MTLSHFAERHELANDFLPLMQRSRTPLLDYTCNYAALANLDNLPSTVHAVQHKFCLRDANTIPGTKIAQKNFSARRTPASKKLPHQGLRSMLLRQIPPHVTGCMRFNLQTPEVRQRALGVVRMHYIIDSHFVVVHVA